MMSSFGNRTWFRRNMAGSSSGGGTTLRGTKTASDDDTNRAAIEKMYTIYEQLNSAEEKSLLEPQFGQLLAAVQGSEKEKRLASQFITRFVEDFPRLEEKAVNALLDLCEEEDVSIRKQVEKDLVTVCKKLPHVVPKIADVFAQLMQSSDNGELSVLQNTLVSLFHINAKGALMGVYAQIKSGESLVRDRCFKFLQNKLKDFGPDVVNLEFEKCLLSETRRVLADLNGDEFKVAMGLLNDTKVLQSVSGQQAAVDMVDSLLDLKEDFDPSEDYSLPRLLICTKQVLPYFNDLVSPSPFLVYYCTKVLPQLGELVLITDDDENTNVYFSLLRSMAELTFNVKEIDNAQAKACLASVYSELLRYLPQPPGPSEEIPLPQFNFSFIECFLFVLHKLGGECPEYFNGDPDKLKDFRDRLQYLARATQAYMKRLREDLQNKRGEELKKEENRAKIAALKTLANITAVIRDLFQPSPSLKTQIGLSWRRSARLGPGTKRKSTSIGNGTNDSREAGSSYIYQPPSGKFSGRASYFTRQGRLSQGSRYQGDGGRPSYGGAVFRIRRF